jgi:hypothetical protein
MEDDGSAIDTAASMVVGTIEIVVRAVTSSVQEFCSAHALTKMALSGSIDVPSPWRPAPSSASYISVEGRFRRWVQSHPCDGRRPNNRESWSRRRLHAIENLALAKWYWSVRPLNGCFYFRRMKGLFETIFDRRISAFESRGPLFALQCMAAVEGAGGRHCEERTGARCLCVERFAPFYKIIAN